MLAKEKFTQLGLSSFFTDSFLFSQKYSLSINHVLPTLRYSGNIVIRKTGSLWSSLVGKTKTKISKSVMKEINWWERLWRSPILTKWSRSPLWRGVAWAKKWRWEGSGCVGASWGDGSRVGEVASADAQSRERGVVGWWGRGRQGMGRNGQGTFRPWQEGWISVWEQGEATTG